MTRAEAIKIIDAALTERQQEDYDYRVEAWEESREEEIANYGETEMGSLDSVDVLLDLLGTAEDLANDPDPEARKEGKKDVKAYNRILLAIGFFRPVTQHEIENTYSTTGSGTRLATFDKVDGVKVTADKSYSEFNASLK